MIDIAVHRGATTAPTPASTPTLVASALACDDHAHGDDCRYRVAWTINPHMRPGAVDRDLAAAQHAALLAALVEAGAAVERLAFVHGAFDSVFAKDSALLLERGGRRVALLARPRHAERGREQDARAAQLARAGFEVIDDPSSPTWEGGDVVRLPGGAGLLVGHGPRTCAAAAAWLERRAGLPVVPLELRDPYLFHLDMALAVLPDGTAVACDAAFDDAALAALERAHGIRHVATVPRADALAFGLNWIAVGDTIVCGARVPRIERLVAQRGLRYRVVDLSQFHLAGGSAACLVAAVHRDAPARPTEPATHPRGAMDLYGPVFRSMLFPLWETHVRRRPVAALWQQLERTQWASRDELLAGQRAQLGALLRHAYDHVPFYRARMAAAGVEPHGVRDLADLAALPIVRRAELKQAGAAWASTAPPLPTIAKQTSGTSGEPLLFGYEPASEHWRRAVKLRGYAWAGYRPGARALHFWGAPEPSAPPWQARLKIALDRRVHRDLYIPCAVMSDEHLRDVALAIERYQPQVVVCYAQAGAELARFITRNGLRSWPTIPVICGAERLLPRDRADLEEAFGPSVFDTYGCREVMMLGAECEAHAGLHVAMENLIVEVVVHEGGRERPAREGESGEVVITDLHNLAMPFIRYANGDIATVGPARRCACGRTLPRLEAVQGRISELLRDGNGAAVSGIALSFLFQDVSRAVRQFQAVQHADRSVTIRMALCEALPRSALARIAAHGQRLLAGLPVTIDVVPELARSPAGKHHLVVVER